MSHRTIHWSHFDVFMLRCIGQCPITWDHLMCTPSLWLYQTEHGAFLYSYTCTRECCHHRSSWTVYTIRSLYCIYQLLQKSIQLQRSHNCGVWNYWQQKLLYCICLLYCMNWLTHELDSNRRMGVWSLPCRWHILSIPLTTGRGTSAETCGLDDVFPPDDLCSRPELTYICIYALLYEFCFLWFTNCVLLSDDISLIPACLWLLAFVLNNT